MSTSNIEVLPPEKGALDRLAKRAVGYALHRLGRMIRSSIASRKDIESEAYTAALQAAAIYDPGRGHLSLGAWMSLCAFRRAHRYFFAELRHGMTFVPAPIQIDTSTDLSYIADVADERASAEADVLQAERDKALSLVADCLSERQLALLRSVYGLEDCPERSVEAIAKGQGVTRDGIYKRLKAALKRARECLGV